MKLVTANTDDSDDIEKVDGSKVKVTENSFKNAILE